MIQRKIRNILITVFVIAWTLLFHYESTRLFYLSPLVWKELPKTRFLFPPAGWIMFYTVPESEGRAEVHGLKGKERELIDPHRIFENRWIGYDNIRRNVLSTVLNPVYARDFCRYLRRKFPDYDIFEVKHVVYPSNIRYPEKKIVETLYRC